MRFTLSAFLPTYFYTAKSFTGEQKTGSAEVADEHELAKALRREGYILISANQERQRPNRFDFSTLLSKFSGSVSLTDRMIFARNLGIMVSAGVALPRSLATLSLHAKSRKLKIALQDVADKINRGQGFSDALLGHQDIFPELFVNVVKVGEESGTLEEALKHLTGQMEKEYELKSKIKGALIYPAVIVTAMFGIGTLMLIVVVPQLAATFAELGMDLPITTRFVIALGMFLATKWYLLPFIFVLAFAMLRAFLSTNQGKKIRDTMFLHFPVIVQLVKESNAAYITRTLSSLIAAGVPIVQALEIISRSTGNVYFKNAISNSAEQLKKGGKLSEALSPYDNLFPAIVIQMIQVGEETGQTAEILLKVADFFEEEVANTTKNLSSVIEPILMLVIGAVVGFFAISMIQPMYAMLEGI